MIDRPKITIHLYSLLQTEYVALLGQRGIGITTLIESLVTQKPKPLTPGMHFITISLPHGMDKSDEFLELLIDRLIIKASQIPSDINLVEKLNEIRDKNYNRTFGFQFHKILNAIGLQTTSTYLVIIIQELAKAPQDPLKKLLLMLRDYHTQRDELGTAGEKLRFLVVGDERLWHLCCHRYSPDQSPFNIAQRVFLKGLSVEEIQKHTQLDDLEINSKIYKLTDGIPSLVKLCCKNQELIKHDYYGFDLLQDHWNFLPSESQTLLQNLLQKAQTFPNCSLDYACPLIPKIDSPWMEAFWAGFLKIEESRLTWRSEIHRKFVSVHTQSTSSQPVSIPDKSMAQNSKINIIHLSDIHLGTSDQAKNYFTQLATDLKILEVKQLNYLVLSGDIANYSTVEEYDAAFELVDKLVNRYGLNPDRVITVPGNHDLNWDLSEEAYDFVPKRKLPQSLPEGQYIDAGGTGALIRDEERYQQRFKHFSDRFYKKVYGKPYPLEYDQQAILHPCTDDKILFLALNSCWELDHHYKDRASIKSGAISHAVDQILTGNYDDWLKIAVWHHPVNSAESMKNSDFLEQLAVNGFQVAMHGHIHEAKDENFQYDVNRGLRIIAAGTFGAPAKEQVTGIPLQYNLLVLNPDNGELTVETRKKEKVDGAWSADARWGDKENPVKNYTIPLNYSSVKKKTEDVTPNQSGNQPESNPSNNPPRNIQSILSNINVSGNLTIGNINQTSNDDDVKKKNN